MGKIESARFLLLFLCIFLWTGGAARAQETEGEQAIDDLTDSYLDEMNLDEIQQNIQEMFPDIRFDLRKNILDLMQGKTPVSAESVKKLLLDAAVGELAGQKKIVTQILILAIAAAVFSNFVRVFEKNQISDIAFYMIYLLLFAILMRAFGELNHTVQTNLEQILHFMKLLLPAYFVVASLAAGSVTAMGFYELTLAAISAAQWILSCAVLPAIRLYVLFMLINYLGREDYFSKLADLIRQVLVWILKTLPAVVIGVQTVQALLLPAVDALKNSVWKRAAGALPVFGNTLNAVTETVLGTAVLLKNAVGVAGVILIALICLAPVIRLAVCAFLYKAVSAAIQPVSDKRITECVSGIGEGAVLLLRTMCATAVMFLITLAMVTASIRGA